MGANVAKAFNNRVHTISLIDINRKKTEILANQLKENGDKRTNIHTYINDGVYSVKDVLDKHHLAVCVTSNVKIAIKEEEIPDYFIVIDDSRPEAISRRVDSSKKIVLEGGLMNIEGAKTNYDYGFGVDSNVFGCLAETYALSIDREGVLSPTIGDVDIEYFARSKLFYESNGINVGNFKTGDEIVNKEKIAAFMKDRSKIISKIESLKGA